MDEFLNKLDENDYRRQIISQTLCRKDNRINSKELLKICYRLSLDVANHSDFTSAQPNSLLGSQQPAFSESPQSATAGADASPAPYATESLSQSPQNPTRQQLLQPQNAQQHLSPSNSPMTHPNVHISATDDSPAARPLENATASNAAFSSIHPIAFRPNVTPTCSSGSKGDKTAIGCKRALSGTT